MCDACEKIAAQNAAEETAQDDAAASEAAQAELDRLQDLWANAGKSQE